MTSQQDNSGRPVPVAGAGEAMSRSGPWLAAGSPPHGFDGETGERWCRRCGCEQAGWQHQPGGQPPPPAAPWT